MAAPILEAKGLAKAFETKHPLLGSSQRKIQALDQVDLQLVPGQTVGVVGESGSGKSTLAHILAKLIMPDAGEIVFRGTDPYAQSIQMIFQSPAASLNPRMRVREIVREPIQIHSAGHCNVRELLKEVGLSPELIDRFPRQLSGGQRQRVAIARALALRPKILPCDEPTASLDATVQAEILRLLIRLQHQHQLAILFISHQLSSVSAIAHEVLVIKEGRVVERSSNPEIFDNPKHEHTRQLISASAL